MSILGPPLVVTREEIDWLLARLDEALAEVAAAPGPIPPDSRATAAAPALLQKSVHP